MENPNRIKTYLTLLKIRKQAYYRNMLISGGMLLFAVLATTATLLFTAWNERSIWIMGIFDLLSSLGFVMNWTRLEITKENMELMRSIQS